MHALILANGKGTNLRPLTVYTPKPILPIVNTPLLLFQIEVLKRVGAEKITLFLDYQSDKIEDLLRSMEPTGVEIEIITETITLGDAGAYRFVSRNSDQTMIILNGDVITDFVIKRLIDRHRESASNFSIATAPKMTDSGNSLFLKTDENNRVTGYSSSAPSNGSEKAVAIDAGIYIIEPAISQSLADDKMLSFENDVFPRLVDQKETLFAFPLEDAYWTAITSTKKYYEANMDFLANKAPHLKVENGHNFERATSAFIDQESVIGADCVIKSNVRIINSSLGRGVQVEEGAVITNSVIWSHTRVSNSASIEDSTISSGCYIGKNTIISKNTVLGNKSSISDYSKI